MDDSYPFLLSFKAFFEVYGFTSCSCPLWFSFVCTAQYFIWWLFNEMGMHCCNK